MTRISVSVDGTTHEDEVDPLLLLVRYLRDRLGLTGTKIGCETGDCGTCTVDLDDMTVKSCLVLAVQAYRRAVTTAQGLVHNGELHPLQWSFQDHHALQCGYCTSGMVMAARDLLRRNPDPSAQEVRNGLKGNLCRCTGYENIVAAVLAAAPGRVTGVARLDGAAIATSPPISEPSNGWSQEADRRSLQTSRGGKMDLCYVQQTTWDNKVRKGYNTTDVPLEICMLQEKAAAAFTTWRKGQGLLGEELADVVLYVASIAEMTGLDLESEVKTKIDRNAARPD